MTPPLCCPDCLLIRYEAGPPLFRIIAPGEALATPRARIFFFFFLSCNDVSYECENSFSPRRLSPPSTPPRDIFIARFHSTQSRPVIYPLAFSLARVSAAWISWIFHRFSFCFLNRYPVAKESTSKGSFGNF